MCNKLNHALPPIQLTVPGWQATVQVHIDENSITLKLGPDRCGVTVAQLHLHDNGEVTLWGWKVSEAETAAQLVVGQGKAVQ